MCVRCFLGIREFAGGEVWFFFGVYLYLSRGEKEYFVILGREC